MQQHLFFIGILYSIPCGTEDLPFSYWTTPLDIQDLNSFSSCIIGVPKNKQQSGIFRIRYITVLPISQDSQ